MTIHGPKGMKRFCFLLSCAFLALCLSQTATAQSDYKKHYESDMEAFLSKVNGTYPFFEVKGLRKEWKETRKRLQKAAKKCRKDAEFMGLVFEGISFLRDAHMRVEECKVELPKSEPSYYTGVSLMRGTDGRVVVMFPPQGQGASLKQGMVVVSIDGKPAGDVLAARGQAAWEAGGSFSSPQRALFFEYRYALRGDRGDKHTLVCLDGKKKKKVKLSCRTELEGWPHSYNLPADLKRVGKSFYYSLLPSGVGYMYLRRVDSSIKEGMAKALDDFPDSKGWVVDLRGNTGGGYGQDLKRQVKRITRPVAVILDAGCISAGETLARDFVEDADARLFGATTAGSSSSKELWSFPSGIATIRISTRGRTGIKGELIEFKGIVPDEPTAAVPEEVQAGKNSSLLRAEEYVLQQ